MVETKDELRADIGYRWISRPFDGFRPALGLNVFDSKGIPMVVCHVNHGQVADWIPRGIEIGPHDAFCAGVMPPMVYADWLEENWPDVPPLALRLLREFM